MTATCAGTSRRPPSSAGNGGACRLPRPWAGVLAHGGQEEVGRPPQEQPLPQGEVRGGGYQGENRQDRGRGDL